MERVLSFSRQLELLPRDGVILCALSGGRDSVALLHFLKEHGFSVAAAHFDHRLRPDSAADADFCRRLCEEWDVPFYQGEGEVGRMPGNAEANARKARYAFLEETAKDIGAARIVTAHNADDNVETVLLHLTRGCGLNGLTGIRPRWGLLARPMLKTPRAAVDAYVAAHALPYVEDGTNADTAYARNRLRHQVLPVLRSLNPRVAETVGRMTDVLREDMEFLTAHRPILSPPAAYPQLERVELTGPGRYDTLLWTLTLQEEAETPDAPPTADAFYLRVPDAPLALRPRQSGDAVHPPFRTGKTVKKWFNELGVPVGEREATPVLVAGAEVLSVAGIGPDQRFLARPGQKSLFAQWTKKREGKKL